MNFTRDLAAMGLAELINNMISMKNNKSSSKKDMESMMKKIVKECLAEQEKKNASDMNSVMHGMMALLQESIRRPAEERQFSELCDMMKKMNVEKEKEEASQKSKEEVVRELIQALGALSDDPKDNSGRSQENRRGNDRGNYYRGNRSRGHSTHRDRDMQKPDGRNDRDQSYRNNRQRSEGRGIFRGRGDFHHQRNFTRNDLQQRDNRSNSNSFVNQKNFEYKRNQNEMQDAACALPFQQDVSTGPRPFSAGPYQNYGHPGPGQFGNANRGQFPEHSARFPQAPAQLHHPYNTAPSAPFDVPPPLFPPPPPPYSKDDPYFKAFDQENRNFTDYKRDYNNQGGPPQGTQQTKELHADQRQYEQKNRQHYQNQKFHGASKKFYHSGNLHNKLADRKHNFHNKNKGSDERPAMVKVTKDGMPYVAEERGERKNRKKQHNKKGKKPDNNAPQISVVDSNESSTDNDEDSEANQDSQDFKLLLGGEFKEENIAKIKDLKAEVKNVIQITIAGDETISYHPKTVAELIDFKKKYPKCQTLFLEKSETGKNIETAKEAKEGKLH